MPIPLAKLGMFASAATASAGTAYGGYYVYVHRGSIFNHRPTQSSSPTLLKSESHEFVIAKVTSIETTDSDLSKSNTKQYRCLYKEDLGKKDSACDIYLLSGQTSNKTAINLHAAADTSLQAPVKASFVANDHVLVKLTNKALEQLNKEGHKAFKIVSTEGNNSAIINLEYVSLINKDQYTDKLTLNKSSLFVMKLSEASKQTTAVTSSSEYECKIGSIETKIPCKVFATATPTSALTHETLKTISSAITTPSTTLVANSYLVVELSASTKSYVDLENKDIVVTLKDTASTEMAKGHFETLLIGNRVDQPASNVLFPVENKKNPLDVSSIASSQTSLIFTKGADVLKPTQALTADQYLCRVIADELHYDDEDCSMFEIDSASTDTKKVDLSKYVSSATSKITEVTKLATGKTQVLSIKKHLQDQLSQLESDKKQIHIIPKSEKDKAWNNKIISLSFHADITRGNYPESSLYSNTFLMKVKEKKATADTDISTSGTPLKCHIDGKAPIDCLVYKFTAAQYTNDLTKDKLNTATTTITAHADIEANRLLVVKFNNANMPVNDLKNQQITLKNSDSTKELASLELDQILFGEVPTTGSEQTLFPLAGRTASFIIEKDSTFSTFSSTAIGASYRCTIAASSSKQSNSDDACSLVKVEPTNEKQVLAYADLISATTKDTSMTFGSEAKTFHKLIVNLDLLYNLSFTEESPETKIIIESIPTSATAPTPLGQFVIRHKLSDAATTLPTGKAHLLIVKATTTDTATSTITDAKCSFSETAPTTDGFECDIKKITDMPGSPNDFTKFTIPTAALDATEAFTADSYFLVDLKANKTSIEKLNTADLYYHYTRDGTTKKTRFAISGILVGDLTASNKNLAYLKTPTTQAR